jgi:hypothetical protein
VRNTGNVSWAAAAALVVVGLVGVGVADRVAGATQTPVRPRTVNRQPDLNGIWQSLSTAYWDIQDHSARSGPRTLGAIGAVPPGQGIVEGDALPYQPLAAAKQKENFANRMTADPEIKCFLPGIPRATYMQYPFQIVQTKNQVLMVYQYASATRAIDTNSASAAKAAEAPVDAWMGYSRGKWEGETLVVDVTGFNDQTWFDRSGNFHSDALHVVERYTPMDRDHLLYEATIEDPKVFTRTWKISLPLYRRMEKNAQLLDYKCVEFAEDLLYGQFRKSVAK